MKRTKIPKGSVNPSSIIFDDAPVTSNQYNKLYAIIDKLSGIDIAYIGNKRKIIMSIVQTLDEQQVKYDSIFDLFSGSACVGIAMKLFGKRVISNDLLTSSYLSALAFVEGNVNLTVKDCEYLDLTTPTNINPFVETHYLDRFTLDEAKFLDRYRKNVEDYFGPLNIINDGSQSLPERSRLIGTALALLRPLYLVLSRCNVGGRLNKGQVLANLQHRLEHPRNKGYSQLNWREMFIPDFTSVNSQKNKALNLDAIEALKLNPNSCDALYIDPPYGQSQSDYAKMYSFCEEYVWGKKSEELSHLQFGSKYAKKQGYNEQFSELLDQAKSFKSWAISYNNDSWASIEVIKSLVGNFRKDIFVQEIDYDYNQRKAENMKGIEYLIIAR